jgi:hypothetical protein
LSGSSNGLPRQEDGKFSANALIHLVLDMYREMVAQNFLLSGNGLSDQ